jgi:hypothetical protein
MIVRIVLVEPIVISFEPSTLSDQPRIVRNEAIVVRNEIRIVLDLARSVPSKPIVNLVIPIRAANQIRIESMMIPIEPMIVSPKSGETTRRSIRRIIRSIETLRRSHRVRIILAIVSFESMIKTHRTSLGSIGSEESIVGS